MNANRMCLGSLLLSTKHWRKRGVGAVEGVCTIQITDEEWVQMCKTESTPMNSPVQREVCWKS